MPWTNSDGLYILFGTEEGVTSVGGEINTKDLERQTEVVLTLTGLTTTDTIVNNFLQIPKGATIVRVETVADAAATSGGAATLTVGLVKEDRTTAISASGLINAAALATINAVGKVTEVTAGVGAAGSLVGTKLTDAGFITAKYATSAFTAGTVRVRVYWYIA